MKRAHISWRAALVDRIRQEANPPDKFSHQARLYALCREIAGPTAYNDDVVFAAAWVHDLGVFVGHRPEEPEALRQWDSTEYTLRTAPAVLRECGAPEALIPPAIECIRTHEAHGDPITYESALLRDADLLEQIGAVAVMRTAAKIGRDTRYINFADAVRSLERSLRGVPFQLRLERARSMAEPRVAALRSFLDALEAESGGELV